MNSKPVVVIGDGWAALGAVGHLVSAGIEVRWVVGSGTRVLAPVVSLEEGRGVEAWSQLASKLGVDIGEPQRGTFLREFRNKSFREPAWIKALTLTQRTEIQREVLWAPERRWIGPFEVRFSMSLPEIEEKLREILIEENFSNLRRIDGIPVTTLQKENDRVHAVGLGSGEMLECEQVIYADRWGHLGNIEGLPKPLGFLRKRDPVGVLQAAFVHKIPIGVGISESFFVPLPREAGEEIERHVWGSFSSDGMRSHWTLCLSPEEVEDNHQIAKKFRRLKNTLDRAFSVSGFIPPESGGWISALLEEKVRFGEELLFSGGEVLIEPLEIPGVSGVLVLSDGYGPSIAFQQVSSMLGLPVLPVHSGQPNPQAEDMNLLHSSGV